MAESKKIKPTGFTEWLKSKGVIESFENTHGSNKQQAKNVFVFQSKGDATTFKVNYLSDSQQFGEIFRHQKHKKYAVPINLAAQSLLKEKFLEEVQGSISIEDCDKQLKMIAEAEMKVRNYNDADISPTTKVTRTAVKITPEDRIKQAAEMLLNKEDSDGWYGYAASSTMDIILSVYRATNDHLLSKAESDKLAHTQEMLLKTNSEGRFAGGLKSDQNFTSYIKEEYTKDKDTRVKLIRENVNDLLKGGNRIIVDKNTPRYLKTLSTINPDSNSYVQPRFFPNEQGQSDTDSILIHAGGMAGHSAIRNLYKEPDSSAPGGYRYYYTKIDGGGGLEKYDPTTTTGAGIYTTEIKPYFKLKQLSNGTSVIDFDGNGNPKRMTPDEETNLNSKPAEYQRHMEATLFSLISAEREIAFFKNSGTVVVDHGEPKATVDGKFDEWRFHNNKINAMRGKEVSERTKLTPIQLSGNCTMYSLMLASVHLNGDIMGYDIMQSAKAYNKDSVLKNLADRKAVVTQHKSNLQDLSTVTGILGLDAENVSYLNNGDARIKFSEMQQSQEFCDLLKRNYDIVVNVKEVTKNQYHVEVPSMECQKIITHASKIQAPTSKIQAPTNNPNLEHIKAIPGLESMRIVLVKHEGSNNFHVQFNTEAQANQFSALLANKYSILGAKGNPKYVAQHYPGKFGEDPYGVILVDQDMQKIYESVNDKSKDSTIKPLSPPVTEQDQSSLIKKLKSFINDLISKIFRRDGSKQHSPATVPLSLPQTVKQGLKAAPAPPITASATPPLKSYQQKDGASR